MRVNKDELVNQMTEVAADLDGHPSLIRLAKLISEWAEAVDRLQLAGPEAGIEKAIDQALQTAHAYHPTEPDKQ